jgi:pimeloyl-[acyl-carrier protein] synthase
MGGFEGTLDFAFADSNNLQDAVFLPRLSRIRERDPVFWSDLQRGWLLTRHEDVVDAFGDPRWSAKRLHVAQFAAIPLDQHTSVIPNLIKYIPDWIINIDAPQHDRIRKLVVKAFGRKVIERMRPTVEAACDILLDEALEKGSVDFVESVAFPLPAMVIIGLMGIAQEHIGPLRGWARDMTIALASHNPSREALLAAEQTMARMNEVFTEEIERRRNHPGTDLLSALVSAHEQVDALSTAELLGLCHVLIIAGHDTTANSLGLGLVALLRNPSQLERYLAGEFEPMQAMTELLRYIAMSSTQIRIAKTPIELRGKSIAPGQIGFLMIAAANRDPAVFEQPDVLDFSRPNLERSATFGPGIHHCLGHFLARMELDILYGKLFARACSVELTADDLQFTPNYAFRGLESIPVRLTAA